MSGFEKGQCGVFPGFSLYLTYTLDWGLRKPCNLELPIGIEEKKKEKKGKEKSFSLNPNTGEEEVQWRPSREANLLLHSSGLAIHSASCSDSSDQGSPLSSQSPLLNQGTSWQTDTPTRTISICIHTVM